MKYLVNGNGPPRAGHPGEWVCGRGASLAPRLHGLASCLDASLRASSQQWGVPQPAFCSAGLSASVSGVRVSALGLIARLLSPLTDTGISPCTVLRRTMRRALP